MSTEECQHQRHAIHEAETPVIREEEFAPVESKDRGLPNFLGKKEEHKKPPPKEEAVIAEECDDKVTVNKKPEEKHISLLEKLRHPDHSSNSTSSDKEEGEDKIKKKGLKEKIFGDKKEEEEKKLYDEEVAHPHHVPEVAVPVSPTAAEKKGFLEKIKEKLPGKKPGEETAVASSPPPPPEPPAVVEQTPSCHDAEGPKKDLMEMIKEKNPLRHAKSEEKKKDGSAY